MFNYFLILQNVAVQKKSSENSHMLNFQITLSFFQTVSYKSRTAKGEKS